MTSQIPKKFTFSFQRETCLKESIPGRPLPGVLPALWGGQTLPRAEPTVGGPASLHTCPSHPSPASWDVHFLPLASFCPLRFSTHITYSAAGPWQDCGAKGQW